MTARPLERAVPGLVQRTPEWLAARRTGIGGSDAPAVLGLSPWRTPFEVWAEKTGDLTVDEREPNEAMNWGTILERAILNEYSRRSGVETVEVGLLRHPDLSWMICSPDAVAADRIVEIKTTRSSSGWGDQGTDEIRLHYLVQVHHNLIVSGAPLADVAVLIAGSDYRIYHVEPHDALYAQILDQDAAFWASVQALEPPPPKSVGD